MKVELWISDEQAAVVELPRVPYMHETLVWNGEPFRVVDIETNLDEQKIRLKLRPRQGSTVADAWGV